MVLPPLQRVPHLERLLSPEESIIYTAKLHPLYGGVWLVAGLVCAGLTWWFSWLCVSAILLLLVYLLPFRTNEIAVTTHRLLLRTGLFRLKTEAFTNDKIENWSIKQSLWQSSLHCGRVLIGVKNATAINQIDLRFIWHPLTFIEALETLQPQLRKK